MAQSSRWMAGEAPCDRKRSRTESALGFIPQNAEGSMAVDNFRLRNGGSGRELAGANCSVQG
jgi:hypothetical protein